MLETPVYPIGTSNGENPTVGSISRKELSAVWLAAAIDGEGCIAANWWKQTDPRQKGLGRKCLRVSVKVYNTHPLFIRKVTECFVHLGIRFTVTGQAQRKSGDRPGVSVCVESMGQLRKLLPEIIPHLTAKKLQAELALQLLEHRESLAINERGVKGRYGNLDLASDEKLQWFVAEIKREKNDFPSVFSFSRKPNEVFGLSSET